MNFKKLFVALAVCAMSFTSAFAGGKVSYTLHKSENPTADEKEAYELITIAMDSAIYYYNTYTTLSKYINVYYSTGVPTAEASSNGDLRFGKDRNYMYVGTAMHEVAHTMGMGTTSEYKAMFKDGVFQGQKAQALLKELDGADAELHGDSQHFWPYGINYRSEVHSEQDLINHAKIVNAMYQDIFKEAFYKTVHIMMAGGSSLCMGITSSNALELMDCETDATIINLYTVGDNPVTYRIELGDRVVDIPNESTAAGVVASTYGWNGGAHQRYIFEGAPVNTPDAFYLQNYKSKLYLQANGTQVLQNNKKQDDSFVWIIKDITTQVAVDPDTPTSSETPSTDKKTDEEKDSQDDAEKEIAGDTSKDASTDTTKTEAIGARTPDRYKYISPLDCGRIFDIKGRIVRHKSRAIRTYQVR
ncbi:RICIN domain-containing protein [Fibrobacter sp.]|uniref:RICIN domain-containing protein n=1 Tax=Fibrobacter sp. TaxID=35828 RepID=UPI003890B4F3